LFELTRGNLLRADAEALVNTVNCVGVMGKGVALQFKQAFPQNFRAYEQACRKKLVRPGSMFIVPTLAAGNPKYIINFPTKVHWKGKSKLEYIDSGLVALVEDVRRLGIRSIAVPPLGCGNGGLDWREVEPRIRAALAQVPDVMALVYEPDGAPMVSDMVVATERPRLTRARALLIRLLGLYRREGYKSTLLEVQKLAYFLQEAGEPMHLNFVKHTYGPYADNLNHVLQRLNGHYLTGYGDRSQRAEIEPTGGSIDEADAFLSESAEAVERLRRVAELIEGFETPYGMELLATIHWTVNDDPSITDDIDVIGDRVRAWSQRKGDLFKPRHIRIAWQRLRDEGWLPDPSAGNVAAAV
jgi:O-acetyl-ADP-ribose deacetylase (regulator of RNase III)